MASDAFELSHEELFRKTGVHHWDAIWIDIWPTICEDNAEEYQDLLDTWSSVSDWCRAWQQDEVLQSDDDYLETLDWMF